MSLFMITPKLQTSGLAYKCRPFFDSVQTHFLKQYQPRRIEYLKEVPLVETTIRERPSLNRPLP